MIIFIDSTNLPDTRMLHLKYFMLYLKHIVLFSAVILTNSRSLKVNVALRKKVNMASEYFPYTAEKAVDGEAGVEFSSHCVHGTREASWIVIDLGGFHWIEEVHIISSNYYVSSLDYIIVGLSATHEANKAPARNSYPVCGQLETTAPQRDILTIKCPVNMPPVQFVIIQQPDTSKGFLTLCEVEVYERSDIDLNPFIGCYEKFDDVINISTNGNYSSCDDLCRNNNKSFFANEKNSCLCGSKPFYSEKCDDGKLRVFAVCPVGFYGTNCSDICKCERNGTCFEGSEECRCQRAHQSRILACMKKNFTGDDLYVGCMKEEKHFRRSRLYPYQSCLSTCKMRGFDYAGKRSDLCWCFHTPLDLQDYCGESDFIDVYAVCPLGTYGHECSLLCFCDNGGACSYETGKCPGKCQNGWKGSSCNDRDCTTSNGLCDANSECLLEQNTSLCACKEGFTRKTFYSDCEVVRETPTYAIILGILLGFLVVMLIVWLLYHFRLRYKKSFGNYFKMKESRMAYYSKQICNEHSNEISEISNAGDEGLKLLNLPDYVAANSQSFADEFKSIPESTSSPRTYGLQKQFKSKNRFRNVIPYDHNRVILKQLLDNESSDYINASYILGWTKSIIIASQGPTPQSVHDFWRMIGEQEVGIIVMLCSLEENNKNKCTQYWPSDGKISFGGYTIEFQSQLHSKGYLQRSFMLETPRSVKREVIQLHFNSWPDHGVPDDILNFLSFHKKFRILLNDKKCTTVIHCSAGVGRTGCFLAIDLLLEKADHGECLDVPGCVQMLRCERANMVETLTQYEFIYNSLVIKSSMGDILYTGDEYLHHFRSIQNDMKITEQIMNQFEMVLQNHCFSDEAEQSFVGRDPIHFRSSYRNLNFVITSKCSLPNVFGMLFCRYNTFIAFDPCQIILSLFTSTCIEDDKHRKLELEEIMETNFGMKIVIKRTSLPDDRGSRLYNNQQLVVNVFQECHDDPFIHFNRLLQLYKHVLKLNAESGQEVAVFNLSESDSAGLFISFSCISDIMDTRGEVNIYDQVVDLNGQAKKLLVKTLSSFQDLHQYALNYLLQKEM